MMMMILIMSKLTLPFIGKLLDQRWAHCFAVGPQQVVKCDRGAETAAVGGSLLVTVENMLL